MVGNAAARSPTDFHLLEIAVIIVMTIIKPFLVICFGSPTRLWLHYFSLLLGSCRMETVHSVEKKRTLSQALTHALTSSHTCSLTHALALTHTLSHALTHTLKPLDYGGVSLNENSNYDQEPGLGRAAERELTEEMFSGSREDRQTKGQREREAAVYLLFLPFCIRLIADLIKNGVFLREGE